MGIPSKRRSTATDPNTFVARVPSPRRAAFNARTSTEDFDASGANCPKCGIRISACEYKRFVRRYKTHVRNCTGSFRVEYIRSRQILKNANKSIERRNHVR